MPRVDVEPFTIAVADEVLSDLRTRLLDTRWPEAAPGPPWQQGTDLAYLQDLVAYWIDGFDWRARERELNALHHFHATVDGTRIHFVHERPAGGDGIPLILTHGWPSSFLELLALVPLLSDRFDLVIPSLPGYGFSQRPHRTGVSSRFTAGLWHQLMRGLGYERYGAHGADWGAAVSTFMALDEPGPMIGLHLANLDSAPYTGPGSPPLSEAERAYVADFRRWLDEEHAYGAIQSTRPQSLAYGLNDSPAALAAWILEKWRLWGDTGGDIESRFSRDFLLTNVIPLGNRHDRHLDARLLRQPLVAGDRHRPRRLRARADGDQRLRAQLRRRGRHAARVGRAPLRRAPLDADAPRRTLPRRRGARAPRGRHRRVLHGAGRLISARCGTRASSPASSRHGRRGGSGPSSAACR
jgi:hypothetical protein